MTKTLAVFLDLTPEQARTQWQRILRRGWPGPGKRQEAFLPVEVILSYALFFVMDPHRIGPSNVDRAPDALHRLSQVFKRSVRSIPNKMLNLDFTRKHGGKLEPELYSALAAESDRFAHLYHVVISVARDVGLDDSHVPDFLPWLNAGHAHLLFGQDELGSAEVDLILREGSEDIAVLQDQLGLAEPETVRVVEQRARMGQHRFARQVLDNYDLTCGFCGFSPKHLEGHRLLLASHIKPWKDSDNRERLDPANGVAACPVHDSAFDTGLLTVNGGLHIHLAGKLQESMHEDARADHYFGDGSLASTLIVPTGGFPPNKRYLDYHRQHIFDRKAAGQGAA